MLQNAAVTELNSNHEDCQTTISALRIKLPQTANPFVQFLPTAKNDRGLAT